MLLKWGNGYEIGLLEQKDIAVIVNGFKESGWQIKPASVFEQY